jgi:hypothetical protein
VKGPILAAGMEISRASFTPEMLQTLRAMREAGHSPRHIAKVMGYSPKQISTALARAGYKFPGPKITGIGDLDEVRHKAWKLGVTMRKLDEACDSHEYFRSNYRSRLTNGTRPPYHNAEYIRRAQEYLKTLE